MQAIARERRRGGRRRRRPVGRARRGGRDAWHRGRRSSTASPSFSTHDLDGIVIATPSAQHAEQAEARARARARRLLPEAARPRRGRGAARRRRGPRSRTDSSESTSPTASRRGDAADPRARPLGRSSATCTRSRPVFHNAYGPDKPWFYDRRLSGGGCVVDLGVHLVDLALWTLDFPAVRRVSGRLLAGGRPLGEAGGAVEDYATARVDLASGATLSLACSWRLPAGREAADRGGVLRDARRRGDAQRGGVLLRPARRGLLGHAVVRARGAAGRVGRAGRRRLGTAARAGRALRLLRGAPRGRGPGARRHLRGSRPPATGKGEGVARGKGTTDCDEESPRAPREERA